MITGNPRRPSKADAITAAASVYLDAKIRIETEKAIARANAQGAAHTDVEAAA